MQVIDFTSADRIMSEGHTSKGDQPKWKQSGNWYKADHMGYEALSEIIVSRLSLLYTSMWARRVARLAHQSLSVNAYRIRHIRRSIGICNGQIQFVGVFGYCGILKHRLIRAYRR